jgi:hypothetical protein
MTSVSVNRSIRATFASLPGSASRLLADEGR